ncbi:hypothetical protein QAD02_007881, partial [Eretmocerus hayati]
VDWLFKRCPEQAAGVFRLDRRNQNATLALGIYFLESQFQYKNRILPYILRVLKGLPKAVWLEDISYTTNGRIPTAEWFSFCLNTLLSDIFMRCDDAREDILQAQVETLVTLTNLIRSHKDQHDELTVQTR